MKKLTKYVLVFIVGILVLISLFLLVKSNYFSDSSSQYLTLYPEYNTNKPASCGELDGTIFQTIEKHEGGLMPNNKVASINWTVSLENNTFNWAHSDVIESGRYSCDGDNLILEFFNRNDTAYYFPDEGRLLWKEKNYYITSEYIE